MKLEISRQILDKYPNIKLNENLPVPAKLFRADGQKNRQTNMTKLLVVFAISQSRLKTNQ
jgi:hypothetical protein